MLRRETLVMGVVAAVAIAIPPILRRIPSEFEFQPLAGFEGFRRLSGGAVSGGANVFAGLDDNTLNRGGTAPEQLISPCLALFGPSGWGRETLPIAIFSDFNCPYCKVLERRLMDLRDGGAPIRLIWHEMPLLGPSSVRYAQAVLAARTLGAEKEARAYLAAHALPPGPVGLGRLATALDLPVADLTREATGPRVASALAASISLGHRLGIPGTPGTVIGRTLVIGAISEADLKKLVQIERSQPQTICG